MWQDRLHLILTAKVLVQVHKSVTSICFVQNHSCCVEACCGHWFGIVLWPAYFGWMGGGELENPRVTPHFVCKLVIHYFANIHWYVRVTMSLLPLSSHFQWTVWVNMKHPVEETKCLVLSVKRCVSPSSSPSHSPSFPSPASLLLPSSLSLSPAQFFSLSLPSSPSSFFSSLSLSVQNSLSLSLSSSVYRRFQHQAWGIIWRHIIQWIRPRPLMV